MGDPIPKIYTGVQRVGGTLGTMGKLLAFERYLQRRNGGMKILLLSMCELPHTLF